VATPARRYVSQEQAPVDPHAIDQAYQVHRARRRARANHVRSQQLAKRRYALLLFLLIVCSVFLTIAVWSTLHDLFGF
jgi:hypothetical protein